MRLFERRSYRNFDISYWDNGNRKLYSIVSGSVPQYLTVHKLLKQRLTRIDAFTTQEDAENWIDKLYNEADEIDKLLADITTSVQFIHLKDKPQIMNLEITTKRELKKDEVIEYL